MASVIKWWHFSYLIFGAMEQNKNMIFLLFKMSIFIVVAKYIIAPQVQVRGNCVWWRVRIWERLQMNLALKEKYHLILRAMKQNRITVFPVGQNVEVSNFIVHHWPPGKKKRFPLIRSIKRNEIAKKIRLHWGILSDKFISINRSNEAVSSTDIWHFKSAWWHRYRLHSVPASGTPECRPHV